LLAKRTFKERRDFIPNERAIAIEIARPKKVAAVQNNSRYEVNKTKPGFVRKNPRFRHAEVSKICRVRNA
jgi:hypothetical protein